ncbi:Endoribonuclease Dicer 2 [Glycine max]|nr:Endoribonuclease Dicer 2 [Glycine max]
MKVYTCVSEVVLTEFMPTSTPKFKFYQGNGVQSVLFEELAFKLKMLKEQSFLVLDSLLDCLSFLLDEKELYGWSLGKKINVHINIIVATSILEEGLDVKSCNLAIRFDPCHTMCSFIQSRGCARMQNSDYILMVKSGDSDTCSRLTKYLASGDIMRMESLCHSSLPCDPLEGDQFDEETYCVASTEAFANLSSSISLIHLYCSRLPADGYFKPTTRWDKETRTLYVPKSCPLQHIRVEGDKKLLKNIACLEACKQLHKIGALSDNLVPDIVIEEAKVEEFGNEPYDENQPTFAPFGLVLLCKKFHVTILIILIDHNMNKLTTGLDKCYLEDDLEIDYLLLPALGKRQYAAVNWLAVNSVNPSEVSCNYHEPHIRTKNGLVCSCKLQNALVLEAITTKRCEEAFHYESLETLGDSFLKYAASQQLFKTYHNHHEGLPKMCSNE